LKAQGDALSQLRELSDIDSRWDQEVLRAHAEALEAIPPNVARDARAQALLDQLQSLAQRVDSPALVAGVPVLRKALEEKRTLLNRYRVPGKTLSDTLVRLGAHDGEMAGLIRGAWQDARKREQLVALEGTWALLFAQAMRFTAEPTAAVRANMESPLQDFRNAAKELMSGICPVIHAPDAQSALAALAEQEVAVIVADVSSSDRESLATFKLLKQEHPEILSILMTTAADSELVIDLINQAQVFRFLSKPVNLKTLQQHVQAALARYQSFKKSPRLLSRHRVVKTEDAALASALRERIRTLKS
jgi:DNA-binding NarL/FixJ family response regulator